MSMFCPDCGAPKDGPHSPACVMRPRNKTWTCSTPQYGSRYEFKAPEPSEGYPGIAHDFETLQAAAELAYGLLWMTETENPKVHKAREVLRDAFRARFHDPHDASKRGIQAAIATGFEADHPPDADWWCGKRETPNGASEARP